MQQQKLTLGSSNLLIFLILLIHSWAGVVLVLCIWRTSPPISLLFLLLIPLLIFSACYGIKKHGLKKAKSSILSIGWSDNDNFFALNRRDGRQINVKLNGNSFITSRLLLLNFSDRKIFARISTMIAYDSADVEQLRRFRAALYMLKGRVG